MEIRRSRKKIILITEINDDGKKVRTYIEIEILNI